MKITPENLHKLTWQAKVDLLRKIVEGAIELDQLNDDMGAVQIILGATMKSLDLGDEDDYFGSEGWCHSILGE